VYVGGLGLGPPGLGVGCRKGLVLGDALVGSVEV